LTIKLSINNKQGLTIEANNQNDKQDILKSIETAAYFEVKKKQTNIKEMKKQTYNKKQKKRNIKRNIKRRNKQTKKKKMKNDKQDILKSIETAAYFEVKKKQTNIKK